MAGNRKLTVEILGDAKNITGAFDAAEKSAGRLSAGFTALGTAGGVALANLGGKAVEFGKQSIAAASDMNETLGATNQIFNTRAEMSAVSAKKVMEDQKRLTDAEEKYADAVESASGKVGKERDSAMRKAEEWKEKIDKAQKAVAENERLNSEAHAKFLKEGVDLGDQYGRSIEDWASKADKAYGQSKQQALDAANSFATFGKAAGQQGDELVKFSTGLSGLASDMASFKNTSPQDAIDALGAALRGENEPMRRYGVLLDEAAIKNEALRMGLYNGKGELDANAKIMATYHAILTQTKDAQGDFARTSESMANQQRIQAAQSENLKVSLGTALLPVMKELTGIATSLAGSLAPVATTLLELVAPALQKVAEWAGKLGPVIQEAQRYIEGLTKVFKDGGLGAVFDKLGDDLAGVWPKIRDALGDAVGNAARWLKEHGPEILRGIGDALKGIGAWIASDVVPAVVDGLGNVVDAIGRWGKEHGPELLRQLGEWTAQFGKWVRDDVAPAIGDALGKAIPALGKSIKDSAPKIADQLIEWTDQFVHWAGGLAGEIGKWIVDHRGEIFAWIKDTASTIGAKLADWTWEFVKWLGGINIDLAKKAVELNLKLFAWIGEAAVHIAGQLLSWTGEFAKWLVTDLPVELAKRAGGFAGSALGWIGGMAAEIPKQLLSWTAKFGEWLAGLPKDLAGALGGLVSAVAQSFFDAFTSIWDRVARELNRKIPFKDPFPTFGGGGGGDAGGAATNFDFGGTLAVEAVVDANKLRQQINDALRKANGDGFEALKLIADQQHLSGELDAAMRLLKPILKVNPAVEPSDIERIGTEISNGLKGKIGAGASNLFANEDIIRQARDAALQAVSSVNANPPAAIKPPVDQDHTNTAIAAATKTAVVAANVTPPAAIQPPVDAEHVMTKAKEAFAGAVASINFAPDTPQIKATVDGAALTGDTQSKAAEAVAAATATIPPVVISVKIDQQAMSEAMAALANLGQAAAGATAAATGAAGAVGGNAAAALNFFGATPPKKGDRSPDGTLVFDGSRWVDIRVAGNLAGFDASGLLLEAGAVGADSSAVVVMTPDGLMGRASDVSKSAVALINRVSGVTTPDGLGTSDVSRSAVALINRVSGGSATGTVTPVVLPSGASSAGRSSDVSVPPVVSAGGTVVGSGSTVIQIDTLIGELSVSGEMTASQARAEALKIYDALQEVAYSKGHVTIDGGWRLGQ